MSTTLSNPLNLSSTQSTSAQFASIQISDALIKFSLYLQKLTTFQQQSSSSNQPCVKCPKLVRLILQTFMKYQETQQFAKQSYQLVKSCIFLKKSYYSLIVMDLMLKNNKYVIKQVKKELETIMKIVWEKVMTETQKEQKIENLKVVIKCWGFIFGDKVEENLRKWLDGKYGIKRIQLNEQNQKALRQTYGQKFGSKQGKSAGEKQSKISQALINSIIDDQHPSSHHYTESTIHNYMNPSDPRLSSYTNRQTSFGNIPMMGYSMKPSDSQVNMMSKKSQSATLPNSNPPTSTMKKSLEGMNKSLLEALDLN